MFDFIIDIIEQIFDSTEGAIESVVETAVDVADNVDLGDVILIGSTIYVANLTVSSIKDELRKRQELKAKGVTRVIIGDFVKDHEDGCPVIHFNAYTAQNKQVGQFSMKGRSYSGLYKGQEIAI